MTKTLIKDATIINENQTFRGSVLIEDERIAEIWGKDIPASAIRGVKTIDSKDKFLIPGLIDTHVHFREPGLTHKGSIHSESKAAVVGGVTSFIDMPNVLPPTTTISRLKQKWDLAQNSSLINFSFYIGATENNLTEILACDMTKVCGIKLFLGSSTGDMAVEKLESLDRLFAQKKFLVAVHCEDNEIIRQNLECYKAKFSDIPVRFHEKIRSAEACFTSSNFAVNLANKHSTSLHILHLSTAKELGLLSHTQSLKNKKITAEVCVHHLFFDSRDYSSLGAKIRWNPSIKNQRDKEALLEAVLQNKIDVISTDHAPHTLHEKNLPYTQAASGGPLVQHSLAMMLELYAQGKIPLPVIVEKMCHAPALLYKIVDRGFIRKGYFADLCLFKKENWRVKRSNLLYKCGWSPVENKNFQYKVCQTFVNGNLVFDDNSFNENIKGKQLIFSR